MFLDLEPSSAEGLFIAQEMREPKKAPTGSINDRCPSDQIKFVVRHLYCYLKNETTTGSDRQAFLNPAILPHVKELGMQLYSNERGVFLMRVAYYCLHHLGQKHGTVQHGDLSTLNWAWNGIGEWRA
jgi:hypothetical protein